MSVRNLNVTFHKFIFFDSGGDGKGGGSSRGLELPEELPLGQFKRSGSERLRDGAKAILRRMESLKNKKKKRQNRDGVVISGPKVRGTNLYNLFL